MSPSTPMKLAIIAGDGIGPEVTAEAVKVLDAVVPGVQKPAMTWVRGAFMPPARCCRTRWWPSCATTTRSCSGRSVTRRCQAASWSAVCCCDCASSWITTSTCVRPGCIRGGQPAVRQSRHRLRGGARGHRGTLHRQRRGDSRRHAQRGGHRSQREHRVRCAACGCRRVRAGSTASQASDIGAQN